MRKPVLLLLLLVALGAHAETPVSLVDIGPAAGPQRAPAIASNGLGALAAWEDGRGGAAQWDVYSTVLDGNAHVVAEGMPVAATPNADRAPAVVWNGSEYVVFHYANGLVATRMTSPREVVTIESTPFDELAASWNGSEYLLVRAGGGKVEALLLDRALHVIAGPLAIGPGDMPRVASNGEHFAVTWREPQDIGTVHINVVQVRRDGSVGAPQVPLAVRLDAVNGGIAWNGRRYLAVFSDREFGVFARWVEPDGTTANEGTPIFHAGTSAAIAWSGRTFLVVFSVPGLGLDLYSVRLDALGGKLDGYPQPVSAAPFDQDQAAVAAFGGSFLVAWRDGDDVRSSIVHDTNGYTSAQQVLALGTGEQTQARGVFDGDAFAFTWIEEGNVKFGRVRRDLRFLSGGGAFIAGGGRDPRIAHNGEKFLLVWESTAPYSRGKAMYRFVEPDGTPAGYPSDLGLPFARALASDGRDFLVMLNEAVGNGFYEIRPFVFLKDTAGYLQDAIAPSDGTEAGLAWTGSRYMLVYRDTNHTLRIAHLDRAGKPILGPRSLPLELSSFRVAAGGEAGLVAGSANGVVTIAVLDADGDIAEKKTIACDCTVSDAVWTGADFAVAFGDRVVRVTTYGKIVAETATALGRNESAKTLVPVGGDQVAIVYDRPAEGAIRRAFFEVISLLRRRASR